MHDDMTFKVIRGQAKVRGWPQSPVGTIFCIQVLLQVSKLCHCWKCW